MIFFAGRIVTNTPAVIRAGRAACPPMRANPAGAGTHGHRHRLSLTAFFAALALQTYRRLGSVDLRQIDAAERLGSPTSAGKDRP